MADKVHIAIPGNIYKFIHDNVVEGGSYKNVTDFLIECGRIKAQELIRAKIDQRKLDAFFLREEQIRSSASHNRTPPS